MQRADHVARVLATGRVRFRGRAPDPDALLAEVEAVIGPAPWAFLLEGDDGVEVRLDVPAHADRLAGWLLDTRRDGLALEVAEPAGLVEALDRGWLDEVSFSVDGVLARHREGRRADVIRVDAADPVVDALGAVLAPLVAPYPLRTDGRGPAVPILHRPSGRPGVELWIGGDPLPERLPLVERLARAVADRPELAPELDWEETAGELQVHLWLAAPPGTGLPGDDGPGDLAWLPDLPDHAADAELRVFAPDPDAVALAVADLVEGAGLAGGPPRWLDRAGERHFVPTWVGGPPSRELLHALRRVPGVSVVEVAPGVPFGLEPRWVVLEPAVRAVGGVCWHRLADPVRDRDWLEEVSDRVPDPRDERVAAAVAEDVRPIVDTTGRPGLELTGPTGAWERLLGAAAAMSDPALSRVGTFGFRRGVVARRWWRGTADPGDRRWG